MPLSELSKLLRETREKQDVNIKKVCEELEIHNPEFITKFESGDFTFLPSIYVFVILKKYAVRLGIPAEVVDQYKKLLNVKTDYAQKSEPKVEEKKHEPYRSLADTNAKEREANFQPIHEEEKVVEEEGEHSFNLKTLLIVSLVGIVLLTGIWIASMFLDTNQEIEPIRPSKSIEKNQSTASPIENHAIQTAAQPSHEIEQTAIKKPEEIVTAQNELILQSREDSCWFRFEGQSKNVREFQLAPKTKAKFTYDGKGKITVGRCESADIWLNKSKIQLPKKRGVLKDFDLQ